MGQLIQCMHCSIMQILKNKLCCLNVSANKTLLLSKNFYILLINCNLYI